MLANASTLLLLGLVLVGCHKQAPSTVATSAVSYETAQGKFRTRLSRQGPAPQDYVPTTPPPGVKEVSYVSDGLQLKAWVSAPEPLEQPRPAVLFLHGGFAFALEDWEMAKPYRDAGFVVFVPMLRGENGLPGTYSMFFHEVDDVLAAADALAKLPHVRADQLYLAGHSVGGTLTMLAAMATKRFRAAAAFSGSPDQSSLSESQPELVPFDRSNASEFQIRSPLAFATSFRCPTRLYYGSEEPFFAASTTRLAETARSHGLDVQAISVPGDHFGHVPESMRQSIEFFHQHQ